VSASAIPALQSPFVKRPKPANLAEILPVQIEAIRQRNYVPIGYLLHIMLGPSDDSAYFQDPVNAAIAPLTRVQGLSLQWDQETYPQCVEMHKRGSGIFLFPDGVKAFPKIADPRVHRLSPTEPMIPKIPQHLDYYASGIVLGRGGEKFYVLQPVMQLTFRIPTTLAIATAMPDAAGKRTALLFSEKKRNGSHTAFLVHGLLRFA
jgi:hypothetical protein